MELIELFVLIMFLSYLGAGLYFAASFEEFYGRSVGLLEGLFYGMLLTVFWPFHKQIEIVIKRRMK